MIAEGEIEELIHSQVYNTYVVKFKNVKNYDFLDDTDGKYQLSIKKE